MPTLKWDPLEVLEYLSVLPSIEEDEVSHGYELVRGDIRMLLTLWQYESVLHLTLSYEESRKELLNVTAFVRGELKIDRHIGTNMPHLCAFDCIVGAGRFSYRQMQDPFDKTRYPRGVNIHLWAQPQIQCLFK